MPTSTANRDRILRAAIDLLATGGRDSVSTRSVSAAAGVQPPALYRAFGDMDGLLDAVVTAEFDNYLAAKTGLFEADDPVDDLRRSFDMHVEFGLSHPEVYALIYGDSRRGRASAVRRKAEEMLRQMISRVAATGRLRMSVERAVQTFHAVGVGTVLTQLLIPPDERDPEVPVISRDNALSAMIADHHVIPTVRQDVVGNAVALREALNEDGPGQLTAAERAMMSEWLNRIANGSATR